MTPPVDAEKNSEKLIYNLENELKNAFSNS